MNKMPKVVPKILSVVILLMVAVACSETPKPSNSDSVGGGAPQAAVDAAFNVVKMNNINCVGNQYWKKPAECKELSVAFATKKDLTPADKENGISVQYAIGVDYLFTDPNHEKWFDGYQCTKVEKRNGSWSANTIWTQAQTMEECSTRI